MQRGGTENSDASITIKISPLIDSDRHKPGFRRSAEGVSMLRVFTIILEKLRTDGDLGPEDRKIDIKLVVDPSLPPNGVAFSRKVNRHS